MKKARTIAGVEREREREREREPQHKQITIKLRN